jgi:hypothetical protein
MALPGAYNPNQHSSPVPINFKMLLRRNWNPAYLL